MELNCPKCKSENTQKITAIVDSGTTHSRGKTTSVGVGSVGGRMAVGSSTGTTNTTHKTALAQKFPTPSKRPEGYIVKFVFGTLLVGSLGYFLLTSITNTHGGLFSIILGLIAYGVTGKFLLQFLKNKSDANKAYNETVYPQEQRAWDNGFYCHRCENVFVPE